MEGWVHLEFTITETGAVADPVVLDNAVTVDSKSRPDDMFNSSALAAIAKWRYRPRIENGVAVDREGVQTIIRYTLVDDEEEANP
jgi:protein TonB